MDSLEDLPSDAEDSQLDEKQREVLDKYLGKPKRRRVESLAADAGTARQKPHPKDSEENSSDKWKTIGYLIVVFIIIANPIIQGIISSNSYINDNSFLTFGVSIVLFIIATTVVVLFL